MKNIYTLPILLILFLSCDTNSLDENNDIETTQPIEYLTSKILKDYELPQKDLEYLQILGFEGSSGYVLQKTNLITEETYISYLMEGDIEIRKDVLQDMAKKTISQGPTHQYRTTNLVNSPRTIDIIGLNIYNSILRTGLSRAVTNYNNLSIGIHFTLEFRTANSLMEIGQAIQDSDILAKQWNSSGQGGQAGYPSGGNPYPELSVFAGTSSLGADVCEHVFTHEIGHCIGLRHTDYFDRSISCTSGGDEGEGSVGAHHIPGTPEEVNVDLNSIMLACFDGTENGEFSGYDITALNFIY